MNRKLAIKGHASRGKEIVEILKMLGAQNPKILNGCCTYLAYYVDDGNIETLSSYNDDEFIVFSLEEFLEKYPFKVGDKVIDKADGCPGIVTEIKWDEDVLDMKYCVTFGNGIDFGWFVNDSIDFLEVNKMKIVLAELLNHIKNTPKEELEREFNELEEWSNVGPTVEEFMEFCDKVNKKSKYPTSYEECCNVMFGSVASTYGKCIIKVNDGYKGSLIQSLQRLIFYRNTYWKIAGEQMGLDGPWEPDWENGQSKFCIISCKNRITKDVYGFANAILAFPTEEMRDAFYENFKDLIELCKELL